MEDGALERSTFTLDFVVIVVSLLPFLEDPKIFPNDSTAYQDAFASGLRLATSSSSFFAFALSWLDDVDEAQLFLKVFVG